MARLPHAARLYSPLCASCSAGFAVYGLAVYNFFRPGIRKKRAASAYDSDARFQRGSDVFLTGLSDNGYPAGLSDSDCSVLQYISASDNCAEKASRIFCAAAGCCCRRNGAECLSDSRNGSTAVPCGRSETGCRNAAGGGCRQSGCAGAGLFRIQDGNVSVSQL